MDAKAARLKPLVGGLLDSIMLESGVLCFVANSARLGPLAEAIIWLAGCKTGGLLDWLVLSVEAECVALDDSELAVDKAENCAVGGSLDEA